MLGEGVGILGDARIILPLRNLNGHPTLPPLQFPNCLPLPPLLILITVSIIWITPLEEFSIFAQTEQVSKQGDHSTQVFPLPLLYPHYDVHLNHLLPINQHKKTWLSSFFVFRANKSQYYHFNSCKKPDLPTDCQQQHGDQKKINLVLLLLLLPYNCVFPLLLVNENIKCCFVSYNCNSIYNITNLMHTLIGIFFFG